MTLIETLVALTIFAIVSGALAAVILNTTALSRNNRSRVVAASLAADELETQREAASRDPDKGVYSLLEGTETWKRAVGETTYTLRRSASWTTTTATADSCTTNAGVSGLAYLRVSVDVTWPRMGGASPVHADTLLTPKLKHVQKETKGKESISVTVFDRSGRGGADHPVTVTGVTVTGEKTEEYKQRTTAEGCAFFAFVPINSQGGEKFEYTASLDTEDYIDPSGNPTPSKLVTETANPTVLGASFQYDRKVSVEFTDRTFPDDADEFPLKTDMVTVANTGDPTERRLFSVAAFPLTADLFPWEDGMTVWAGSCDDAEPANPLRLDLAPGTSTSRSVPAARVRLTVTRRPRSGDEQPTDPQPTPQPTDGQSADPQPTPEPTDGEPTIEQPSEPPPADGVAVTARHAPEVCPSGRPLSLGTTGGGGVLQVSLPYGRWQFDAGSTPVLVDLTADDSAPVEVALVAP